MTHQHTSGVMLRLEGATARFTNAVCISLKSGFDLADKDILPISCMKLL